MERKKWNMAIIIMCMSMIFLLVGCKEQANETTNNDTSSEPEKTGKKPVVTMIMEDGGEVEMELYPDVAPNTVDNFIHLIEDDFYEGLIFHRVIYDFMVQGGDPDGDGTGGPGYSIEGEFTSNGHENNIEHEPGVLSMARSQDPDSAGSQFFIVTGDGSHLDGDYAAFGKVISGMDTIEKIEVAETDSHDKPTEDQVIEAMTVDLKGYEAKEPVKE